MTTETLIHAPLAQLVLAPENARAGLGYDADSIQTLAGSITARGRLLEPLKAYRDGDRLAVWDGGRRLAALQALQALPPALLDPGVPLILTDRADAALDSATTFLREGMHPADRFLLWNALFDDGQSHDMIAASVGATAKDVARLLRFRVLAPDVLAAFKAGRFDLDAAFAFTNTDNHDDQLAVLASFGEKRDVPAHAVRTALRRAAVRADDHRARWVGRDVYEAAGGRFLVDLFTRDEADEAWADEALLQRLYDAKRTEFLDKVAAEGWGDVIVAGDPWSWRRGYVDAPHKTKEEKAQALAIVVFNPYEPAPKVHRGFAAERKAAGGSLGAVPPAKADPARYGFSHLGHMRLTTVATTAAQTAVAADPALAYDALVAHMAWVGVQPWGNHSHGSSKLGISYNDRPKALAPAVREALEGWRDRLPNTRAAFVEAVAALSAEDKAQLLALSYAASLDAIEPKVTDAASEARQEIGWLARRGGVDFASVWTPDDDFLKRASKDALLAAVEELAPGEAARWAGAKKGALVEFVRQKAEATGWVPQLLRDLVAEPEAPSKPAKKPRKAKAA